MNGHDIAEAGQLQELDKTAASRPKEIQRLQAALGDSERELQRLRSSEQTENSRLEDLRSQRVRAGRSAAQDPDAAHSDKHDRELERIDREVRRTASRLEGLTALISEKTQEIANKTGALQPLVRDEEAYKHLLAARAERKTLETLVADGHKAIADQAAAVTRLQQIFAKLRSASFLTSGNNTFGVEQAEALASRWNSGV
jgi:chromosome segregation ATPase